MHHEERRARARPGNLGFKLGGDISFLTRARYGASDFARVYDDGWRRETRARLHIFRGFGGRITELRIGVSLPFLPPFLLLPQPLPHGLYCRRPIVPLARLGLVEAKAKANFAGNGVV